MAKKFWRPNKLLGVLGILAVWKRIPLWTAVLQMLFERDRKDMQAGAIAAGAEEIVGRFRGKGYCPQGAQ